MNGSFGNLLIVIGLVAIAVGLLFKAGLLGWFGHLPGDIRIKREGFSVFIPITSMILISVGLSLGLAVIRRFL